MADFSFPSMPAITPPPQTSLADMMGIARGAQAYQQAEQINPLALQQQQAATQTAQQGAQSGAINLDVLNQENKERLNLQQATSSGEFLGDDGKLDLNKFNKLAPKIAPLTWAKQGQTLTTLAKAQTDASLAKQNLTTDQRAMIGQRFSILGRLNIQDKDQYIKEMDLMKQENPDNPDLHKLLDSYKTIWQTSIQSGPDLPGKAIAGAQSLLTAPQQETAFTPTTAVTPEGRVVTTTRTVGGGAPSVAISTAGGLQGSATGGGAPVSAGTKVAEGMTLPYAVRSAEQPYIPQPTEAKDQAAGAEYRNNLVNGQMGLAQGRRNVQEVIKQATGINEKLYFPEGGVFGQAEQKILSALKSDQYDLLAKDLANMHISNAKAMGTVGGTVAGLDMASVAGGTVKVPPKVLIEIARRVQADQTNLDMQANGAQQFAQKFGDNNMKAYQQAWNANADSKIFEAMNITRDVTDPVRLKAELNKLFPNPKDYQDFLKKYQNIKKLSETGSL